MVNTGEMNFLVVIGILLVILVTVGIVIYVEMGERRVPVSYSRKVVMENQNKRIMNYIPIKVNLSGVIPPIFASAILMFRSAALQIFAGPQGPSAVCALQPIPIRPFAPRV